MAQTGRQQRETTKRARLRRPDLNEFYNRRLRSIEPGGFVFRIVLVRPELPRNQRYATLDRNVTDLGWGDGEGSQLTGSMTVRRPGAKRVNVVPIQRGHRVRLLLLWGGRWQRLWNMRVPKPPDTDVGSGAMTVTLEDDLGALAQNEKQWEFKKDKRHPQGWTADEITRFVCKDQKVRPGRIAKGRRKIKKLKLKGSGLEVIRKAWALEKEKTLNRYVVRFRDTVLDVLPYRRPGTLYVIRSIEKTATTEAEPKEARPVTQIKAKGRIKTGSKHKKVEETVRSPGAIAKFGRVEKEKDYGRVDSRADLREQAKRDLAASIKVDRTASMTIPGIPWLEKGSPVRWITNEPGWHGRVAGTNRDRSYAFVTGAQHTLVAASYDTEVTIIQDDPYFADRQRRDEERRDKKKKERAGRKPKVKAK